MNKKILCITMFMLFTIVNGVPPLVSLQHHTQHMQFETYHSANLKPFGMFGFAFDTFLTESLFYSISIFGAVGGDNRGGFGVAMGGIGTRLPLMDNMNITTSGYVGGGGGGALPVMGGLALRYQVGIEVEVLPKTNIEVLYGHIRYPTGTLETDLFTIGLSHSMAQYVKKPISVINQKSILQRNLNTKRETTNIKPTTERFKKHKELYTIGAKAINYSPGETIALFGCNQKQFIDDHMFFGKSGYAVITGKRAGYIEGGLLFGYETMLWNTVHAGISLFTGAAGGGQDVEKEGGGWVAYPSLTLRIPIVNKFSLDLSIGQMQFINGTLKSPWIGLYLSYEDWILYE